jgi:hypothetical protein
MTCVFEDMSRREGSEETYVVSGLSRTLPDDYLLVSDDAPNWSWTDLVSTAAAAFCASPIEARIVGRLRHEGTMWAAGTRLKADTTYAPAWSG